MKEATVIWAVQRHPPYALSATRHSSCCLHHNRGTRGLHQSRNVFNQFNNAPTPPREPPPFWPTRVRVQHDSYIRSNRATVWQLMRDVTPADQWEDVSVVLATLESIYGVEYQGLAAQLLTAFQEANLAPRPLDTTAAATTTAAVQQSVNGTTTTTNSSSSNGRNREDLKQQQWQQQEQQQQYEHLGASVLGLNLDLLTGFRRSRRNSSSRGSSPEITTDDQDDDQTDETRSEQQQQQQQQRTDTASRMDATTTRAKNAAAADDDGDDQEEQQAAAAVADALFMQLLLLLAQRAGFVPLTERDLQLSISLNTDYLWQLFVKANTKQLDAQFIQQHVQGSSSSSNGSSSSAAAAAALELPRKARSMLVLRRGYSSEKQRRRWLIQKLDYLQLLLVKRLLLGVTGLAAAAWNQVAAAAAVGGGTRKGRLRSEQVASDRRDPGSEKSHVHALNVEVEQQAGSRNDLTAEQQQQQQLLLQSKQSQQQVKLHQHGKQQRRSGQPIRSSSSSSGRQKQRRQQQRPKTDAFGRVYDYVETEDEQNHEDVDIQVVAAAAVSGSSSSKARQQEQQPRTQRWQQQLEAGGRRLQQQTKQHQRSLASRVVNSFNDRLMVVAHTLSDWGLIPRMDVIPLERFDEVFPLDEPPRLKPLYIEKATLPDIMDPVIEPRLKWLAPHGNNSMSTPSSTTALTAADGYSSSSIDSLDTWELSPSSSGMKQADNSSRRSSDHKIGFFDALLQPVEIVEPTFRQLLVVYRKKARRDRWKELSERLTGQKQTQTAARRSPIQLQVYRDIPLPSWQVVFPDKLLQFRPLDLLRLDLFGLAGVGAALAQAKYSSIILQLFALASLSVWGLRITLGFLRMGDRYKTIIAQLLAERTVAGGEGGLEYLATAAGLQQFKQAALVYVILVGSNRAMTSEEIAIKVEALLEQRLKLQVCFNTEEALQELQRFGLLVTEQQQLTGQQQQPTTRQSRMVAPVRVSDSTRSGTSKSSSRGGVLQQQAFVGRDGQQQQPRQLLTCRVLSSNEAQNVLQQYWAGLLRQRVNSILNDV